MQPISCSERNVVANATCTLDPRLLLRQDPACLSTRTSALSAQFNADANQELSQTNIDRVTQSINSRRWDSLPNQDFGAAADNFPKHHFGIDKNASSRSEKDFPDAMGQRSTYTSGEADEGPWNQLQPSTLSISVSQSPGLISRPRRLSHELSASVPIPIIHFESPLNCRELHCHPDNNDQSIDDLAHSSSHGHGSRLSAQQMWTNGYSVSKSSSTAPSESACDEFHGLEEIVTADQSFSFDAMFDSFAGGMEDIDEITFDHFGGESNEQLLPLKDSGILTAQNASSQQRIATSMFPGLGSTKSNSLNGEHSQYLAHGSFNGVPFDQGINPTNDNDMFDLDEAFPDLVSSDRHRDDLSNSYPPTAHFFPSSSTISTQQVPKRRPRRRTESNMLHLPHRQQLQSTARKCRSGAASNSGGRQNNLPVILEGGSHNLATSPRGRRTGPLSDLKAAEAAKKRSKADVCIRCRKDKASCRGDLPCERCREDKPSKWKQPCVKATFLDLVRAGPCNKLCAYTFTLVQRSLSHPTLDRAHRMTEYFSEDIDIREMIQHLESMERCGTNAHVCPVSDSSYIIDVAACLEALRNIQAAHQSQTLPLPVFLTKQKPFSDSPAWLETVQNCRPDLSIIDKFIQWCNMPSRSTYYIVKAGQELPGQPLDMDNLSDKRTILVVANLNRIICRAVELAAFGSLQEVLTDLLNKPPKMDTNKLHKLVHNLGEILCLLRWRMSWWAVFGDDEQDSSVSSSDYATRILSLSQTLYFYFFIARTRLVSLQGAPPPAGATNRYSDDGLLSYEEFPTVESFEGFQSWMEPF